jgi:hypothetical protein
MVLSGSRVSIEERGEGPTLLCLHGLDGGVHFFAALAARL